VATSETGVLGRGAVDYTQSSSLAELACRWAEQRRLALEVFTHTVLLSRYLSVAVTNVCDLRLASSPPILRS